MSVICRRFFTETCLEDVDPSKTQPRKYFACMDRGRNPSQEGGVTVLTAVNNDTFWLQSIGTHNSSLANTKIYMFLLCFILGLRAISKYKPPGSYILRGNFKEGFLALRVWEGLIKYLEGLIFGILRYLQFWFKCRIMKLLNITGNK